MFAEINVGDVYKVQMTLKDGITPKDGFDSREKFFVVLGFDSEGNVFGGVVVNSRVNYNLPPEITDCYMPIKSSVYSFLRYDSFVNCSTLKTTTRDKLLRGVKIGKMTQDDYRLIVSTVIDSPLETPFNLKRFGLL